MQKPTRTSQKKNFSRYFYKGKKPDKTKKHLKILTKKQQKTGQNRIDKNKKNIFPE